MKTLLTLVAVVALWSVPTGKALSKTIENPKAITVTEHVYFKVKVYDSTKKTPPIEGVFVVAVFGDDFPMTGLNFVNLAKGYKKGKKLLAYNGTVIHRIIPDFIIQMGDVSHKYGDGGESIFGETFQDETFKISHSSTGIVSMANKGRNTNNSQFFITLQKARHLDSKHVAFGKVIAGMDFLLQLGEMPTTYRHRPKRKVEIVESGVEGLYVKYDMTGQQLGMDSEDFGPDDFLVNLPKPVDSDE